MMKRFLPAAALLLPMAGPAIADDFMLHSPDIAEGRTIAEAQIFQGFGCNGGNRPPALAWTDPPPGTRSLAVTVYDPDAPTGSGWWHWVVFGLPAATRSLVPGSLPAGAVESRTDFGPPGYGGPCPPAGDKPHRYVFTVHAVALDRLPLEASASGAMVGYVLKANTLASAAITARYGR